MRKKKFIHDFLRKTEILETTKLFFSKESGGRKKKRGKEGNKRKEKRPNQIFPLSRRPGPSLGSLWDDGFKDSDPKMVSLPIHPSRRLEKRRDRCSLTSPSSSVQEMLGSSSLDIQHRRSFAVVHGIQVFFVGSRGRGYWCVNRVCTWMGWVGDPYFTANM